MKRNGGWTEDDIARRVEDLAWMADTGESAHGAAERLELSFDTLERWAHRNNELVGEIWRRLTTRDPRDHNDVYRVRANRRAS